MSMMKMYEISALTIGNDQAKNLMSMYVSQIKVMVANAYLINCLRPRKLDSGNTIYLDSMKPIGKPIQNEIICAPTGAVIDILPYTWKLLRLSTIL